MLKTAKDILTTIYNSDEVRLVTKKLKPEHLQEDILQHTFLELYEIAGKRPEFIIDLSDRGKLKSYIVKILYNTATYTKSSLAKQLGKESPMDFQQAQWLVGKSEDHMYECTETLGEAWYILAASQYAVVKFESDEEIRQQEYRTVECALCELDKTASGFNYKEMMLREYAELGTYQAVANKTGIPLSSVYKTITEARKQVKNKL